MKPARIKLSTLLETAKLRPPGWLEAVLAAPAVSDGRWVTIPAHRYSALRLTYAPYRPSLIQKIRGLFREIGRWKSQGFRVAHWKTFLSRSKACKGCPFTVPVCFGLLNTCGRCGCTRAKLWLESARCPERRWPH
jgi:hypothetical protein